MTSPDFIESIKNYNRGRDPERLAMKYKLLRKDPFTFLRGTCHLFYEELPKDGLPHSPAVWTCGDLHLQNFGSFKGDNQLVYFDIIDFDEAVLAPALWEISRILASILVGVRVLGLESSEAMTLCNCFLFAYRSALREGKARWIERDTAKGIIRDLLNNLRFRKRNEFLDNRTVVKGKKRRIKIDRKKALDITEEDRTRVVLFMKDFAQRQKTPELFEVIDAARRIAGNGSLGVERYIILVEGGGSPGDNFLLDLKQAIPSCVKPYVTIPQPAWESEAQRVITVQHIVQAISPAFSNSVTMNNISFILKELQPTDDKVDLRHWNGKLKRLKDMVEIIGRIAAWGQIRSSGRMGSAIADELIEFSSSDAWISPLISIAIDSAARLQKEWEEYVAVEMNV